MSSRSTSRSQWVPIGQGLPVWEIDAAHAAECRHSALFRTLDPAPAQRDFVGAARAGGRSRRSVYGGTHPSGRAVRVPPAATARDSCTVRPQSHSAKNPSQDQVTVRQTEKRLLACCKTMAQLGEFRSNQTAAFQLQKTKARGKIDILARAKKRDSIVPPLLARVYISRAHENPQHAHIVLQHLLEPSLLPCPAPHTESPRETATTFVFV